MSQVCVALELHPQYLDGSTLDRTILHKGQSHFMHDKHIKQIYIRSEFSSQGHFHSLQLLNVPQFLFCLAVRLKTAARGNFGHP